ncbi:btaf1 RNA polymerase II, B-TFIID transcription factor-associated, 170kDa [Cymbomonas tetramitiformis]|uniref:Btaf1 RNA polymerase II, B-TFIID transcription factor-associated, 170kDa n=1 Tax=Cymbomonas tetramitiformis TaxID=36881 RepID=A0AAE0G5W8_9CHLO|nr:btaf1 RNA polymerase II, B-TFIID transcription factor-associated, 170kDa [Cymbomonas tetramitiformis]
MLLPVVAATGGLVLSARPPLPAPLRPLSVLTQVSSSDARWAESLLSGWLPLTFQHMLVEDEQAVARSLERVWKLLMQKCSPRAVAQALAPQLNNLYTLALTLPGSAMNTALLHLPGGRPDGVGTSAQALARWVAPSVEGDDSTASRRRKAAAEALAQLACRWSCDEDREPLVAPLLKMLESSNAAHRQFAATITCHWLRLGVPGGVGPKIKLEGGDITPPQELLKRVEGLLAAPEAVRYSELTSRYSRLRSQTVALARAAQAAGSASPEVAQVVAQPSALVAVPAAVELARRLGAEHPKDARVVATR